jgi:hypothetical protein
MAAYVAHYNRLIERARTRELAGYCERHHVIPRCMGGSDDPANIVRLTPEEHYVAHQLLVKMHPEHPQLIWAAHLMASRPGNKLYGWMRRRMSEARRGRKQSPEHIAKLSAVRKGRKRTPEQCAGTSRNLRGFKRPPETIEKMRAAAKLRGVSQKTRDACIAALTGRPLSEEHKAKMRAAHAANPYRHSEESKAKMRKAIAERRMIRETQVG